MSYNATFWSFAKKTNSTKQPTATGTIYTVDIMDGSGILSPTIKLLTTGHVNPVNLTYCHISAFGRYYFINNWRYDRGLWWADLTVDVLASYKSSIGGLSMYILRSSSQYDGALMDNKYPVKTGLTISAQQNNSNPFATTFSAGYFVIGIINGDSGSVGAVSYYVFDNSEFRAFAAILLGDTSYLGTVGDISTQLLKCLVNPFQYIVSCTWLPVTPPMGTAVTAIPIGWWSITANAHKLSGSVRSSGTVTVQIPRHPDAATRGAYLNTEPYSTYYLDFPPFGSVNIPANAITAVTTLDFAWNVDCITGIGRLSIGENAARPFNILHGQIGVPVQLSQMAPDIMGSMMDMVPTFSNQTLNNIVQGSAGFLAAIGTAKLSELCPAQSTVANGGFMGGYYPIKLVGMFASIAPDNTAEWGRPLCQVKQISTLSGFVQTADEDFEISCAAAEREQIAAFLTGGFYYE